MWEPVIVQPKSSNMHRILIVEDYPDLANIIAILLRKQGFAVETCYKADEVFSKLYSFNPDLIVMDLYLDNESGKSLCMKIKESPSTSNIPVILISGHQFPVEYLMGCHYNDFIQKPFSNNVLIKKIESILKITS